MRFKIIFYSFLLSFSFLACSNPEEEVACEDAIEVVLTDYTGLDGCQWILVSSQVDFAMEPINLNDFFDDLQDGMTFQIAYVERPDLASICLVGRIVEISCVE